MWLRTHAGVLTVALLALWVGGVGFGDERYVSLHGDMPRHLMNGVFLRDLAGDIRFSSSTSPLEYANLYYARYPALSLGHHPPLLPLLEAPLFALFGISVTTARVVGLVAFVTAAVLLYRLVEAPYDRTAAMVAGLLFVLSPTVVILARSVLSEVPTLALVMGATYALHRFCETQTRRALVAFVVLAGLSLYAKQLAVFMFPVWVAHLAVRLGIRRLLRADLLIAAFALFLLTLPLALMTVSLSPRSVGAAVRTIRQLEQTEPGTFRRAASTLQTALASQFAAPVLLLAAVGVVRALVARDRRAVLLITWVVAVGAGVAFVTPFEPARYAVYWVPAIAALAGVACAGWTGWTAVLRVAAAAAIVIVVLIQGRVASEVSLERAGGFEEAAEFVLRSNPGPTVLFSGDVDTGYFSFFVRKHDPERRLVVLRADKIFTTSRLGTVAVEDRIERPEQIYDALNAYGTRYIVIEDRPSTSTVLEWLRTELRGSRFRVSRTVPITSAAPRLAGTNLVVYEYLDARPPSPTATVSMHLPMVNRSVMVPLRDLIDRKGLR